MIYLTQLIYVKKGKETIFHEFEEMAIPLMEKYGGKIIHRIRPEKEAFINNESLETPYEIHFITFVSDNHLTEFLNDKKREKIKHLKEESVRSVFLVKGEEM